MDDAYVVVFDAHAEEDIEAINAWWESNRPAAPTLFADELAEVVSLLTATPEMGHPYRRRGFPGLRRVLLRSSRYHLYYVLDGNVVVVLTVWSSVRRRGPTLKR